LKRSPLPSSDYPRAVLDRLLAIASDVLAVERVGILMQDDADPAWVVAVAEHGIGPELVGRRLPFERGMAAEVIHSGKPVAVSEYGELARPHENDLGLHAGCSVPIEWAGRVRGALSAVGDVSGESFGHAELAALAMLGRLAAAALEHADMVARLAPNMQAQVGAMDIAMMSRIEASADVIEQRDGYEPGRRRRLAELTRQVGERLGLPARELEELELAARHHNAGKYKLPDTVLSKPDPLDRDERELVTLHPEWGAEALARVPGLEAVAAIVLFHNERLDGSGYPYGLEGARIPLASRIIGACDAIDAMRSDRPYRERLEPVAAEGELRAGSPGRFDRTVVEAVLSA
jgi:HD-GYP domain-containing protein (c-di-GMP phosphodiesterase class II)